MARMSHTARPVRAAADASPARAAASVPGAPVQRSAATTFADLDRQATDEQIKRALVAHFDCPPRSFDRHAIVRHAAAIVVRPEAIYG